MPDPPLEAGAVQVTVATAVPFGVLARLEAPTPVGAPGTVKTVTAVEAADATLVPSPLVAVTVKV